MFRETLANLDETVEQNQCAAKDVLCKIKSGACEIVEVLLSDKPNRFHGKRRTDVKETNGFHSSPLQRH